MKKSLNSIIPLLSLSLLFSSCALFRPEMKIESEVPVKVVFANVLDQYKQAETAVASLDKKQHKLTITEADVIFDNVITNETDASLSLLIFKGGYTRSKKKETTVTYSLVSIADPESHKLAALVSKKGSNPNAMRDLIVSATKQFIEVALPEGEGNFEKDIEIDIAFTVDQTGSIEISGPIAKFTPDVTLSRDVANTHTITVKIAIDKK